MTKEELIGLVKLGLGNAGEFHENQIHLNVCLAWEQMLAQIFARDPKGIDRYALTFPDIEVKKDTDTGVYYSDLPMIPIKFVDIADGLRRVYKKRQMSVAEMGEGDDIIFVPMVAQHTQLLSNVDGGKISDVTGYFIKDTKVLYYKPNTSVSSVYMDIVPSLDKVEYETELVIPPGGVQALIGITMEIQKGTPYVDPRLRRINIEEI